MSPFERIIDATHDTSQEIAEAHANWLEDVLAGLLSNGVRIDEIEIRQYLFEQRTTVYVRGKLAYEWVVEITTD